MKIYDVTQPIVLKRGVYDLNSDPNFNYQINRVINWDGGRLEDVEKVSRGIRTSADWKRELIALGDAAMREERTDNAIAYYRMSEFFMYDGDPDKKKYYELATKLFYEYYAGYFEGDSPRIERLSVPYAGVSLPVMHIVPDGASRVTLLLHGGNDSYFEEFLFSLLYLQELGYEVYLFEGPGQGGVIRTQGMHFTHEWEKPVKAVLDFLKLDDDHRRVSRRLPRAARCRIRQTHFPRCGVVGVPVHFRCGDGRPKPRRAEAVQHARQCWGQGRHQRGVQ